MLHNRSVNTDAHRRPRLRRTSHVVAGYPNVRFHKLHFSYASTRINTR